MLDVVYHEEPRRQEFNFFFDKRRRRYTYLPKLSKQNGRFRRKLAERYANQIDEEGIENWDIISVLGWELYEKDLRKSGGRFKGFEQRDGIVIAVSSLGRRRLPEELEGRVKLVDHWLAWMPSRSRVKGPHDFGGRFKGSHFPPSEVGRFIRLDATPEDVKAMMTEDGVSWYDEDDDVYMLDMQADEAERYVRNRFISSVKNGF